MTEPPAHQLRELVDLAPDGLLAGTVEGRVLMCNPQAAALLGTTVADAVGDRLEQVLRLQDRSGRSWLEANQPFRALGIERAVPEQSWVAASGEEVLTTARLLRRDPRGPVTGVVVGLRSGRGRERLDRERSDLVATVAHELRSPLTGVKGFVGALLTRWDRLTDEQRKLMLTTAHSDADRLARLISELLDVARLDTGRLQLHRRPVDGAEIARRVVESVAAGTSRQVEVHARERLPPVLADPDKLTQVLTNLVENGVKHGAGDVSVEVTGDSQMVRFVVEDEGEGIPAEMRRRSFTKFWTAGVSGGSGLGLYIVRGLTRAHGGEVVINETAAGGARLTVDWPAAHG